MDENDPINQMQNQIESNSSIRSRLFEQPLKFLLMIALEEVCNSQNEKFITKQDLKKPIIQFEREIKQKIDKNDNPFKSQILRESLFTKNDSAELEQKQTKNALPDFRTFCNLINLKFCEISRYQRQEAINNEAQAKLQEAIQFLKKQSILNQNVWISINEIIKNCEYFKEQHVINEINTIKDQLYKSKTDKLQKKINIQPQAKKKKAKPKTSMNKKEFSKPISKFNAKSQSTGKYSYQIIYSHKGPQTIRKPSRYYDSDPIHKGFSRLAYSYIGRISIYSEKNKNFVAKGTGTLIDKAIVLTAYQNVQLFVSKEDFSCANIKFQLYQEEAHVIKIQYSEFYNGAFLYLDRQMKANQIFTLITHNSDVEKSNLVGKNYYCQMFGVKQNTDEIQMSCGNIFIEQTFASGFQYQLSSADHPLQGSALIIYPSGKYLSEFGCVEPFILGIHTMGNKHTEADFKRKNAIHKEKYNYGIKIMKDFMDTQNPKYFTEISCIQNKSLINKGKYGLKTKHQNQVMFSDYHYLRNRAEFAHNYLLVQQKDTQHLKEFLAEEVAKYFKAGIYFDEISRQNVFFYMHQQKAVNRFFNVKINVIPSQYRDQKEVKKQKQERLDKLIDIIENVFYEYETLQELHNNFKVSTNQKIEDMLEYLKQSPQNSKQIFKDSIEELSDDNFDTKFIQSTKYEYQQANNYEQSRQQFNFYRKNLISNITEIVNINSTDKSQTFNRLCWGLAQFIILKKKYQIENDQNNGIVYNKHFRVNSEEQEKEEKEKKEENEQSKYYNEQKYNQHYQKVEKQINEFIIKKDLDVEKLDLSWIPLSSPNQDNKYNEGLQNINFANFYKQFNNDERKLFKTLRKYSKDKLPLSSSLLDNIKSLICLMQVDLIWSYFFHFLLSSTGVKSRQLFLTENNLKVVRQMFIPEKKITPQKFYQYQEDLIKRAYRLTLIDRLKMSFQQKQQALKSCFQQAQVYNFYITNYRKDFNEFQKIWNILEINLRPDDTDYNNFTYLKVKRLELQYNFQKKIEQSNTIFRTLLERYEYFANRENLLNVNKIIFLQLRLFSQLQLQINFQLWTFMKENQQEIEILKFYLLQEQKQKIMMARQEIGINQVNIINQQINDRFSKNLQMDQFEGQLLLNAFQSQFQSMMQQYDQ